MTKAGKYEYIAYLPAFYDENQFLTFRILSLSCLVYLQQTLIELKLPMLFKSFVIYFLLGVTLCACMPVIHKNISITNMDVTLKLFIISFY